MAESGTMITSGAYRNNSKNSGGAAGGGGNLINQAANMISAHAEKQQASAERLSSAQWEAVGRVTVAQIEGETQVKTQKLQNQNAKKERENALELEKTKGQQKRLNVRTKVAQVAKLSETLQGGTKVKYTTGKTTVEGTMKRTAPVRKPRTPRATTPKVK